MGFPSDLAMVRDLLDFIFLFPFDKVWWWPRVVRAMHAVFFVR